MPKFNIKIIGNSMSPTFKDGDTIYYTDEYKRIHIGDIILFKDTHGKLVTHRVVKEGVTKGDRSYHIDESYNEALGLVIGFNTTLWDHRGQPLKDIIARYSLGMISPWPFRLIFYFQMAIISKVSSLLSPKTSQRHIEEILK